jgi:hypothetical protein
VLIFHQTSMTILQSIRHEMHLKLVTLPALKWQMSHHWHKNQSGSVLEIWVAPGPWHFNLISFLSISISSHLAPFRESGVANRFQLCKIWL